ncbi:hypothetical protein [Fulvivirga sediminis]|uniref:Uncharacterized protein n=1 Tax=Fulvivirga sediminis TaxID=2803949 RepID=A0A937FDG3_9BACT|nr:hypothetical protein [Fulvivirga sediminis]MBL3658890.1 hypothetical protein [Fulvivirga sediminis]
MKMLILILLILNLISCGNGKIRNGDASELTKTEVEHSVNILNIQENCEGRYILTGVNDCQFVIDISGSDYHVKTTEREIKGSIEIKENEDEMYLLFKGFVGDDPEEEIVGKYEEGTIIIQNYGNSVNPYTRLNECSDKYLVLERS